MFQKVLRDRGNPPPNGGEYETLPGFFYQVVGIWRVILTIQSFFKAKTTSCRYCTSIKIKLSMTCVYKEHQVKTKMVQEQWLQLKRSFHWVITWKLLLSEGIKIWRVESTRRGEIFSRGEWASFQLVGDSLYTPSAGKPLTVNAVKILATKWIVNII